VIKEQGLINEAQLLCAVGWGFMKLPISSKQGLEFLIHQGILVSILLLPRHELVRVAKPKFKKPLCG